MLNLFRAVVASLAAYLALFVLAVLAPFVLLLLLWTGACLALAVASFFFWLLVNHQPSMLRASLYLLLWGFPPCLLAGMFGFYEARLKAGRAACAAAGEPFSIAFSEPPSCRG